MKRKKKRRQIESMDVIACVSMVFYALVIFFPFYNALLTSLMSAKEYTLHPVSLYPREIVLDSYAFLLNRSTLLNAYGSSIMVTSMGVALSLSTSVMMAFAFSRPKFIGKRLLFGLVLFTMFFDGGLIPTYLLIKNLGLINSRLAIILMCGVSAFNIILLKNGFEQTPSELEDAAKIDGANEIRMFWSVLLPLQLPILATIGLFIAVGYWNEWFWSMLILNSPNKQTLQMLLRSLIAESTADTELLNTSISQNVFSRGIKMAAVVVTMLPIMMVYPFIQRFFVKGLLIGAIKM